MLKYLHVFGKFSLVNKLKNVNTTDLAKDGRAEQIFEEKSFVILTTVYRSAVMCDYIVIAALQS
jgi:hypothetical protein